ncbi:M23 family metallopeptidase [Stenotrophobium rhamnosiphilum]|uniref:Peptidase M23 n=1 Tax=Stenotrophobium rhamnosiphilum TaxID=2029166 RepID=A0A2T5MBE6_9GAMM|nr:M23 family metallopeptidase [Stenotrophobium rhamnosiphilum]PTU29037.1 peptidase M23 [Stenotrophobium rhamnosiphilum]
MKQDYSLSTAPRRLAAWRSVLMAGICAVSLTALLTREGTASRHTATPNEATTAITTTDATTGAAFDTAVQDSVSDTLPIPSSTDWVTVEVKANQTISSIIEGQGMAKDEWLALMALGKSTSRLKKLRSGDKISLRKNSEGELEELSFELDQTHTLQVRRVNDKLEAITLEAELERRIAQAAGTITHSLYVDGAKAGLSKRQISSFVSLFNYDVDFALGLSDGDRFVVIYETLYKENGEKVRDGDIIAASLTSRGRTYRSMRYTRANGTFAYYAPDGQSPRKAFIRTPVDFARISSGFNLARRHPILNIIRAHKGVDYAAATGTPVKATADGKVEFKGIKSGYGNVIVLKHGSKYETVYAHLSRYREGLRQGQPVRQGQVIGYVGSTGLATAPHLHYEFHVNGQYKNPLTVALPRANPLSRSQLAKWRAENALVIAMMDELSPVTASNDKQDTTKSRKAKLSKAANTRG